MIYITVESTSNIQDTIEQCIMLAKQLNCGVKTDINGWLPMYFEKFTTVEEALEYYRIHSQ